MTASRHADKPQKERRKKSGGLLCDTSRLYPLSLSPRGSKGSYFCFSACAFAPFLHICLNGTAHAFAATVYESLCWRFGDSISAGTLHCTLKGPQSQITVRSTLRYINFRCYDAVICPVARGFPSSGRHTLIKQTNASKNPNTLAGSVLRHRENSQRHF